MKTRTRYNPAGRCSNSQGTCERCGEPTGSAALRYCGYCARARAKERAEREARYAARMAARPPAPSSSPSPWDAL